MKCEHELKRPWSMRVSNVVAMVLSGLLIGLWLPMGTNFFLTVICISSVMLSVDTLHFILLERPYVSAWLRSHKEYHEEEVRATIPTRKNRGKTKKK